MQRAAIERRIRHLQREMVRAAMSPGHGRELRTQALIRALAVERIHLKREMSA